MPSPERSQGGPPEHHGRPEQPHQQEQEPLPYQRTARFTEERSAAQAYAQAQEAIVTAPCDLSAYRFLVDQVAHVAVIGEPPPAALDEHLREILAAGEPSTLPRGVLLALTERRRRMSRQASWREGHYRPGRPL